MLRRFAAITGMTVKINGKTTLKCVGKNPRLSQAKVKNDKNIAGLLNSVEVGKTNDHRRFFSVYCRGK